MKKIQMSKLNNCWIQDDKFKTISQCLHNVSWSLKSKNWRSCRPYVGVHYSTLLHTHGLPPCSVGFLFPISGVQKQRNPAKIAGIPVKWRNFWEFPRNGGPSFFAIFIAVTSALRSLILRQAFSQSCWSRWQVFWIASWSLSALCKCLILHWISVNSAVSFVEASWWILTVLLWVFDKKSSKFSTQMLVLDFSAFFFNAVWWLFSLLSVWVVAIQVPSICNFL